MSLSSTVNTFLIHLIGCGKGMRRRSVQAIVGAVHLLTVVPVMNRLIDFWNKAL